MSRTTRSSRSSRPVTTPEWPAGWTNNPRPGSSALLLAPSTCRPPMRCTPIDLPSRRPFPPVRPGELLSRLGATSSPGRAFPSEQQGPRLAPSGCAPPRHGTTRGSTKRPRTPAVASRTGRSQREVAIASRIKECLRALSLPGSPGGPRHARRVQDPLPTTRHAARGPKAGAHHRRLVHKIVNFHIVRVSNGPTEASQTSSSGSGRSASASATSSTTASERCSTPAG